MQWCSIPCPWYSFRYIATLDHGPKGFPFWLDVYRMGLAGFPCWFSSGFFFSLHCFFLHILSNFQTAIVFSLSGIIERLFCFHSRFLRYKGIFCFLLVVNSRLWILFWSWFFLWNPIHFFPFVTFNFLSKPLHTFVLRLKSPRLPLILFCL